MTAASLTADGVGMHELMKVEVGRPYPQADILPPGDSSASHLTPTGLMVVVALTSMSYPERDGFRDGTFRFAVGRGPERIAIVAMQYTGSGWADSGLTKLDTHDPGYEQYHDEQAATLANWSKPGAHGMVQAVLVDRDHNDEVAGLRLFTLSKQVTSILSRILSVVWAGPPMDPREYERQMRQWQQRNPNTVAWVARRASATCKGGD